MVSGRVSSRMRRLEYPTTGCLTRCSKAAHRLQDLAPRPSALHEPVGTAGRARDHLLRCESRRGRPHWSRSRRAYGFAAECLAAATADVAGGVNVPDTTKPE